MSRETNWTAFAKYSNFKTKEDYIQANLKHVNLCNPSPIVFRHSPFSFDKIGTLQQLAAERIKLRLYEKAFRAYLDKPCNENDDNIDHYGYEYYLHWGIESVLNFVAQIYQEYTKSLKQGRTSVAYGFSFKITQLPVITEERLDALIKQSLSGWRHVTIFKYSRYPEYTGPVYQPFTLKFLTLEAIKRQWFVATNVHKVRLEKHHIFCAKRKIDFLERKLVHIKLQNSKQTQKYALNWIRNGYNS